MPLFFLLKLISSSDLKLHLIQDELNVLSSLNSYFDIENDGKYDFFCGFTDTYRADENFIANILIANECKPLFYLKKLDFTYLYHVSEYTCVFNEKENQIFNMKIQNLSELKDCNFFYLMIYPKEKGKISCFVFYCHYDIFDGNVQYAIGKSIYCKETKETQSLESKFAEEMGRSFSEMIPPTCLIL